MLLNMPMGWALSGNASKKRFMFSCTRVWWVMLSLK